TLASVIFFSLPFALLGGVIAAFAVDGLSLAALTGLLAVFGLAARNSIMQIKHYHHLAIQEDITLGRGLILRGARERFGPVLMTTLVTGVVLVPLVVTGNIPGQEIAHPMAIVILGGLVSALLYNLFVVPRLYMRFGIRVMKAAQVKEASGNGY